MLYIVYICIGKYVYVYILKYVQMHIHPHIRRFFKRLLVTNLTHILS